MIADHLACIELFIFGATMTAQTTHTRSTERVAVIGAGTMGAQIAALIASSGRSVAVYDAFEGATVRGFDRIRGEILPGLDSAGMLKDSPDETFKRLRIAPSLADAVEHVDMVIEAVREEIATKRSVFTELSKRAPSAILSTNSSSLPSAMLVDSIENPERLLNTHFFAPIWIRTMLELMSCGETSDEVMESTRQFGESLGLTTAVVRGQSKGFIINRIWRAVKRESLRVVDEGHADPEDVDRLWMLFFQTEYAPFGVMDMVGLDVVADIETSYQAVTQDPTDKPSAILYKKISEGKLGEKSGEGFYKHPNPSYAQPEFRVKKRSR
jgi:3-hydroxybutyryl-CoA dehydrogenase